MCLSRPASFGFISPMSFGASGNGTSDDTSAVIAALTFSSQNGKTYYNPTGKSFRVTQPLFAWGSMNITGPGEIVFDNVPEPYLLNFGISGKQQLETPFTGKVYSANFRVISGIDGSGGSAGDTLFFWRSQGAIIAGNLFNVGQWAYSATGSGNNNSWVSNGFVNCIRKDIRILGNRIESLATNLGSEGYGLEHWDGAVITDNIANGVGDDPIGIHFCTNIQILRNKLKSTDGRIFISQSQNVEVGFNRNERIASLSNGQFYTGISLLYVGFETLNNPEPYGAPETIFLHDNTLVYPVGAIDAGAAIYLYATRNLVAQGNQVINNSVSGTQTALHILPAALTGTPWVDPTGFDPGNLARVYSNMIDDNNSIGSNPLEFIMTGNSADYIGPLSVIRNTAKSFSFYSPASLVNNISTDPSFLAADTGVFISTDTGSGIGINP